MCGIYGMVSLDGAPLHWPHVLEAMGQSLVHRGPDDRRVMSRPDATMGVERLRITDLRAEAAQPFTDPDAAVWLGGNGAIYNAEALRRRYTRYPFRSRSDIEPIVPLYLDRGPTGLSELDGMFALAIWDTRQRRLILARDRAGEKPLFYTRVGSEAWFASEVQALIGIPGIAPVLDRRALDEYCAFGYVLEPRTMFAGIRKIRAGTILSIASGGEIEHRYWEPEAIPVTRMPVAEAVRQLGEHLERAVAKQLVADVPVGVFTSGGLDSALLAALAQGESAPQALRTFTVGFEDPSYDEHPHAARLATSLGTRHVTARVAERDLCRALETVSSRVAEPLADPAVLPTFLLAEAARRHVGVVLSGEGADELFGGYPTYLGHRMAPWFQALPAPVRRSARRLIETLPTSHAKVPLEFLLKRFVEAADCEPVARHIAWFGTGLDPSIRADPRQVGLPPMPPGEDLLRGIMLFDYRTYLRDGLLPKVDRATMLASLEARSPYLDRAVTEFALGLDTPLRVRGVHGKWVLRRVARTRLPPTVIRRRKRGLSVPIAAWLNGGLRREVDRLLASTRLRRTGLFDPLRVHQLLSAHRSGQANHARPLWALVVFELWRERWMGD